MGFIDIPNISDQEICNTNYEIRNINIKPNNVEDHSIFIEIEFSIACSAFENKEVNIPENSDAILKCLYGDYMKLPPEKDRIAHGVKILKCRNIWEEE